MQERASMLRYTYIARIVKTQVKPTNTHFYNLYVISITLLLRVSA